MRVRRRIWSTASEGRGRPFGAVKWVQDPLWNHRDAAAAIVDRKELAIIASVPVVSGEGEEAQVDGVLAAAFPLGAAEVEALEGITSGKVAFLTNTARSGTRNTKRSMNRQKDRSATSSFPTTSSTVPEQSSSPRSG